jgi:hypothetical protein
LVHHHHLNYSTYQLYLRNFSSLCLRVIVKTITTFAGCLRPTDAMRVKHKTDGTPQDECTTAKHTRRALANPRPGTGSSNAPPELSFGVNPSPHAATLSEPLNGLPFHLYTVIQEELKVIGPFLCSNCWFYSLDQS